MNFWPLLSIRTHSRQTSTSDAQPSSQKPIVTSSFRLLGCALLSGTAFAQTEQLPTIVETPGETGAPNQVRLIWDAEPDVRYELKTSPDMVNWTLVDGYPKSSDGLSDEQILSPTTSPLYARVNAIDEQPPEIIRTSPRANAFAVKRDALVVVELEDPSGIDPASLSLTAGSHGPFTLNDAVLTWENNQLVLDLDQQDLLGTYGTSSKVTLNVADTLGNVLEHSWFFDLEIEPIVAGNIFVFGSSAAINSGQALAPKARSLLAARRPVISQASLRSVSATDDWTLVTIGDDLLVIDYSGAAAPSITTGTLVCNNAPATLEDVFYRRVLTVDDNGAGTLTLTTEDVPLTLFLQQASIGLSQDSVFYDLTDTGDLSPIQLQFVETGVDFGNIGVDVSGAVLFSSSSLTLSWDKAFWLFRPSIEVAVETEGFSLTRFEARVDGALRSALVPLLEFDAGISGSYPLSLIDRSRLVFLGFVGPVPVWLEFGFELSALATYQADINATLTTGIEQDFDLSFGVRYTSDALSPVEWIRDTDLNGPSILPLSYTIDGSASAQVSLTPKIELLVASLAGVFSSMDPRLGFTGSATLEDNELTEAEWTLYSRADLQLGLSITGLDDDTIPNPAPISLYAYEWSDVYPSELEIRQQPMDVSVEVGQTAILSVDAIGPRPVGYQWYQDSLPLPGRRGSILVLPNMALEGAGEFSVRMTDANGDTLDSTVAVVEVIEPALPGFARIPGGAFVMGDPLRDYVDPNNPFSNFEPPLVHTVNVSEFYMATHEVTNALWYEVREWALLNGYTDLPDGFGFEPSHPLEYADDHPVRFASWYDAVKWCNAMSERSGLTPCYYTSEGEVFRVSDTQRPEVTCNWEADGFRLPTEAEWEKAARGGFSSRRFPWGNKIEHSRANYQVVAQGSATEPRYFFDVNPTLGLFPDFIHVLAGSDFQLGFTSPVGYFPPNGYGLFDVIGNVGEHCWDYYNIDYYESSPTMDPTGPEPVNEFNQRVQRGGSWADNAFQIRTSKRLAIGPWINSGTGLGFRLARRL